LNDKWKLSKYCEIYKDKNKWKCKVFLTKEVKFPKSKQNTLGIDVGIKHSTSRSDRYLGKNLLHIINKEKKSQTERQRQKHIKKNFKTKVKQILDREVNYALRRSKHDSYNISIENPKILANLKMNKFSRWAKCYFANRLKERAIEEGIYVIWFILNIHQ